MSFSAFHLRRRGRFALSTCRALPAPRSRCLASPACCLSFTGLPSGHCRLDRRRQANGR